MKLLRLVLPMGVIGIFVLSAAAMAQDTDTQKLIEIEKAFSANATPGPKAAAVVKLYDYDGNMSFMGATGLRATVSKSQSVELNSKPNPSDPNAKGTQTLSDIHVDLYGDTALVNYKMTETDTGHKDAALNTTDHDACLDTFVKRSGRWYIIGSACASTEPMPEAEWEAIQKSVAIQPKDLQQAIH